MKNTRIGLLVAIALLVYAFVLLQYINHLERLAIKEESLVSPTDRVSTILTTINVNTTEDELSKDGNCSLREAVIAANTDSPVDACSAGHGVDLISLPAGIYILTTTGKGENASLTGDLNLTSNLYINGSGADSTVIDGNQLDRVFEVISPAVVSISGLTIQNGDPGTLEDAQAYYGGGISIVGNATLTLSSVSIRGNRAYKGGGLMNNGGIIHIEDSAIVENTAEYGGGIVNQGVLDLVRSSIESNHAEIDGGGILSATDITMQDCTVNQNTSSESGGGLYLPLGEANIDDSTISTNSAFGQKGSAIWAQFQVLLNLTHSTLTNNLGGDDIYYSYRETQAEAGAKTSSQQH